MADSFIQLTTDGSGKQLDTVIVNMGVGTTAVHREKMVVSDPLSTTGFATVTSSAGLQVNISSGTVTSTAATSPWSSAPGFNMPVVTVSSGLVQISGNVGISSGTVGLTSGTVTLSSNPTVITASSGFATVALQVISTAGYGPVTSSAGLLVSVSSGTITLSSAIGISSGTVGLTSGTVTLSSNPTVISASSGLVQISGVPVIIITTSAFSGVGLVSTAMVPTQVSTVGGPTVTSASSGLVQISGTPTVTMTTSNTNAVALVTSGQLFVGNTTGYIPVLNVTTSGGTVTATTSFGTMQQLTTGKIVPVLQASSGVTSIDLWQGSSQFTNVYIQATTISKISSGPCQLFWCNAISTTANTGGIMRLYNATTANVVMNSNVVASRLVGGQSSGATIASFAGDPSEFGPLGMGFNTACSFDVVLTATSTATVAAQCFVSAIYSTK